MQFKTGDRVRVTRIGWEDAELYATLRDSLSSSFFRITDTSISVYEDYVLLKPHHPLFSENKRDYYTLVTDEEDSEPVEVQYIESENKVELDDHYIVEVKKGLYVEEVGSNNHFKFTKDIKKALIYKYKESNIRHAELVDGRILPIKRHIEV